MDIIDTEDENHIVGLSKKVTKRWPNLVDQKKDFISAFNAKRRGFGGYAPVKQVPSGTKRAAAAALFCASDGG